MRQHSRRVMPFILAGLLLLNVAIAIAERDRWHWLVVAFLALTLAGNLWQRGRSH